MGGKIGASRRVFRSNCTGSPLWWRQRVLVIPEILPLCTLVSFVFQGFNGINHRGHEGSQRKNFTLG
jgi:hypothetical protein